MDQQKPEDRTAAQGVERVDKPLGRGLEDISHLFLSNRMSDAGERDLSRNRPPERTPPQPGSSVGTILLKPCTSVTGTALAAMLKEHQDCLEGGLRVIDAHIPCYPHSEIDLLALDFARRLTIIDFDTASSDELLLRGLGHFDWILQNLPTVRRMHSGQTINMSDRPRLFLLSPRFSPLLLSASRQLTEPQVNCVRYHVVEASGMVGMLFEAARE